MRVIAPGRLLAEAADVLASVRDDVVVVGAAAIEVALADTLGEAITPTRDVDVVVPTERAAMVVAELERAGMRRSALPHAHAFIWVRDDLKVQLVRTFHPFPKPPARMLPANPVFGMAANPAHQTDVAFTGAPTELRLRCANAACLIALKHAAFGRTRQPDNIPVERDYHDVHLLLTRRRVRRLPARDRRLRGPYEGARRNRAARRRRPGDHRRGTADGASRNLRHAAVGRGRSPSRRDDPQAPARPAEVGATTSAGFAQRQLGTGGPWACPAGCARYSSTSCQPRPRGSGWGVGVQARALAWGSSRVIWTLASSCDPALPW